MSETVAHVAYGPLRPLVLAARFAAGAALTFAVTRFLLLLHQLYVLTMDRHEALSYYRGHGTARVLEGLLAVAGGLSDLVCFFALLIWIYGARRLLIAIKGPLSWSALAGVLWWFAPVANLVMPYRMVSEIWRASTPEQAWRNKPVPGSFRVWWACFVIACVLCVFDENMYRLHMVGDRTDLLWQKIAPGILFIVAAFLLDRIVRTTTRRLARFALGK